MNKVGDLDLLQLIGQTTSYVTIAVIVAITFYKGLPRFIDLYTVAQENMRKTLEARVTKLEDTLDKERKECEEKVAGLWERIEKMRQIVNHLLANRAITLPSGAIPNPMASILHQAYDLPAHIAEAVEEMNRMPGTREQGTSEAAE